MSLISLGQRSLKPPVRLLDGLAPLADLAMRLYVANVFFQSGLLKFQSWGQTKQLFEYVYAVPLLPPNVAAALATAGELVLPVMLAVGLAGRFGALGLTVINIVAVISFPDLNDAGLRDHLVWGLMLAALLTHGPGKLSVDHLLRNRFWP